MSGKTKLEDLSILELLQIKRSLGRTTSIMIERLGGRLTDLVAARLRLDKLNIYWNDIAYYGADNSVLVSGVRMLEIGDEVEEEGVLIVIDENNVDEVGQAIRLLIPPEAIAALDDPKVSTADVIAMIDKTFSKTPPPELPDPQTPIILPSNVSVKEPVEADPSKDWLYQQFDNSKIIH